ncbi:F-box domain containing protein [Tanacetum coccineum]
MSDNIPFDIQMDIMNRIPVKSLLQFRTVSKQWKSCIDFINFQNTYGVRSSNDYCMILRYNQALQSYMLALDHNLTYSPLQSTLNDSTLFPIGTCYGIWCFSHALSIMATLWNPSIKRSINILVPAFTSQPQTDKILLGFGVHPDTLDLTIIKISYPRGGQRSWYVSVFTLSSTEWNKLKNDCLPRESIRFKRSSQAVVGWLLFWAGHESWSLLVDVAFVTSFTLFFVIPTPNYVKLLGFTNDEIPFPIVEVPGPRLLANSVQVYNRFTQSLQNLGIEGVTSSFYIGPYKESLILLPYPDRELYYMFLA